MGEKKLILVAGAAGGLVLILLLVIILYANPSRVVSKNREIAKLENSIVNYKGEIERLNEVIADTSVKEVKIETSLREVEVGMPLQFETIDDKIIFPNKFKLPYASDDGKNTEISVGSKFKFTPSENWNVSLKGATLDLAHPAKIWGTLKGVVLKEKVPVDSMEQLVQDFFIGFPATTISYRNMFLDGNKVGLLGTADIVVDGGAYVVSVGFAQRSDYAILFLFAYEDDGSFVQKELVDLLIRSGMVGDMRINLD